MSNNSQYGNLELMNKETVVYFRKATKSDIVFLSHILISATAASGVRIQIADLSSHPDAFQYVEGFPNGNDIGVVFPVRRD